MTTETTVAPPAAPEARAVPASTAAAATEAVAAEPAAPAPATWVDWLLDALRHEPAHALTLFYLGASALGLWASYWFFASFGIPVMDYMDPSDYITVGLRDPVNLLIVALAMALMLLLNFHEYAREKGQAYYERVRGHWWGRLLLVFPYREKRGGFLQRVMGWSGFSFPTGILLGMIWATLWLTVGYVQHKAEDIRNGGGHAVRITLAHAHEAQPGTARLLGTIGDFVFLYWPEQKRAEAIAVEAVGRLQSVPATRTQAAQPATRPAVSPAEPAEPAAKPASAAAKAAEPAPAH